MLLFVCLFVCFGGGGGGGGGVFFFFFFFWGGDVCGLFFSEQAGLHCSEASAVAQFCRLI